MQPGVRFRACLNLYDADFERDCQMNFACDVIDEVALLAKSERSRSYVTEERAKRHWQDPQKQSNMNFRQALRHTAVPATDLYDRIPRSLSPSL